MSERKSDIPLPENIEVLSSAKRDADKRANSIDHLRRESKFIITQSWYDDEKSRFVQNAYLERVDKTSAEEMAQEFRENGWRCRAAPAYSHDGHFGLMFWNPKSTPPPKRSWWQSKKITLLEWFFGGVFEE